MTCDVKLAKKAFEVNIKRADKLLETMEVTKEGEVLANTKAAAEKALELLNKEDYLALNDHAKKEFHHDLATSIAREQLGGVFSAAIRKNPTAKSERSKFAIKQAKHRYSESVGDIVELVVSPEGSTKQYSYSFIHGNNVSRNTPSNNTSMFIPHMHVAFEKIVDVINGVDIEFNRTENAERANKYMAELWKILDDNDDDPSKLLGAASSLNRDGFDYTRASLRKNYRHGSKEDMKNMLADLHALGGRQVSNKYYKYYDELLDNMHEHFFRAMNLYINENQDDNQGWVDVDKEHILLNTSKGTDVSMSNTEVYMHEVIHTMTGWALKGDSYQAIQLRERLEYLKKQAFKSITWQDLQKTDSRLSVNGAKERFNYIFGSENTNDEFLAYALTNPGFMELLENVRLRDTRKTGLFSAIKDFFADLMNALMGNYPFSQRNQTIKEEVHTLAFMLADINNSAEQELKTNPNLLNMISDGIDTAEEAYEGVIQKITDYFIKDRDEKVVVPKNMNHAQKVLFTARFFLKSIFMPNFRHVAGTYFSSLGLSAQSSIREVLRSVLPPVHDHLTTEAELLGLRGGTVDQARNIHVANTANSIITNFNKTPTDEEQEALTSILLEANGSSLFNKNKNLGKGYSNAQLARLFGDSKYREKVIRTLKTRIKKTQKTRSNWLIAQAEGLGVLMATGEGHKAQNTNTGNIVRGYLTSERHKMDEGLYAMIEELASLTAISRQDEVKSISVAGLFKAEEKAVRNIVNLYEAFKGNSRQDLFKNDASHLMEGYIRELYDDDIETTYAVLSKKEELEKAGFKLRTVIEANDLSGAEAVGFFVSDTYTRPERLSGAVSLGNPNSRGMTLQEVRYTQFHDSKKHAQIWFEADKAKYNTEAVDITKQLEAGIPLDQITKGPVPVLDATGNVVDYRNMMNKKDKAKYLKQNRKVVDVLSKTAGTVVDKVARQEQNKLVLKLIRDNVKNVYDNPKSKDNLLEYTLISAESNDPELRKLFYQLPKEFQRFANNREDKSLPVPSMLMDLYFGYSQGRITDFPGMNKVSNSIKRIVNMFEKVWVDLVKIVKGNILLKMPIVLVVNIISNIIYGLNTGVGITEIVGAYKRSITDVHKFMQKHKKKEALKVELLSLTQQYNTTRFGSDEELKAYDDEVSRLTLEISNLNKEMDKSEVKELFDLGMYQAVIEDVNMYKLGDTNVISDTLDKYTNKLPTLVKTPLQWLYLSKETKWYETNQYVLQMSDLVARDVMNKKQKLIEKQQVAGERDLPLAYRKAIGNEQRKRAKLSEEEAASFLAIAEKSRHANLMKAFVNYNLPNGKGEEFLNRYGVLMFTKYVKRIQNVIADAAFRHPIRSITALLAAGFALDIEMIQDQSFLVKAGDNYGLYGLTPVYSPADIVEKAVTPPLVQLGQWALGR